MKRVLAWTLCFLLALGGFALADDVKTSFDAETVLMPALFLQMSVPSDLRDDFMNTPFYMVEYDMGMRYSGGNDDLRISIWAFTNLRDDTTEDFAKRYIEGDMEYVMDKTELNGYPAFHIWRAPEPESDGYILADTNNGMYPEVAYTIFFAAYTEAGEALRDEIISTIRRKEF